jgi:SWI/SNF-related matrix-associated actin-dependent regulator of chromatin subfamily A3
MKMSPCESIHPIAILFTLMTSSYQHVLTGAKRPRQDEALSGIVADDMGLGKSLVMLSTIATSSDRAKAFAQPNNTPDEVQEDIHRVNSRATLILTPSTRKLC